MLSFSAGAAAPRRLPPLAQAQLASCAGLRPPPASKYAYIEMNAALLTAHSCCSDCPIAFAPRAYRPTNPIFRAFCASLIRKSTRRAPTLIKKSNTEVRLNLLSWEK